MMMIITGIHIIIIIIADILGYVKPSQMAHRRRLLEPLAYRGLARWYAVRGETTSLESPC